MTILDVLDSDFRQNDKRLVFQRSHGGGCYLTINNLAARLSLAKY